MVEREEGVESGREKQEGEREGRERRRGVEGREEGGAPPCGHLLDPFTPLLAL